MSATIGEENGVAADDLDTPAAPYDHYDPETFCLSPHLPTELCGLPRSEISPLCCNANLALSACCVHADRSSLLVVFVSNASDSAARRFILQMTSTDLEVLLENVVF